MTKRKNPEVRRTLRTTPDGAFEHVCPVCGIVFRDNKPSTLYCTFAHKQKANNHRHYLRYRESIIARVRQAKQPKLAKAKKSPAPNINGAVDLDSMSPAELMEYIRLHPHLVKGRR